MTPLGIEPVVVQCFNHYATAHPIMNMDTPLKLTHSLLQLWHGHLIFTTFSKDLLAL